MKKYAFNHTTGEKCFCKVEIGETGIMFVKYYLPKSGFSILWLHTPQVRIHGVRDTNDGRKTTVTYMVHPSVWEGKDFEHPTYWSFQDVIDALLEKAVKLHV